jgi:hypothetical protein
LAGIDSRNYYRAFRLVPERACGDIESSLKSTAMNIEQIFEKRLDRNINGVVKAEQTDDASAWIELDEYVITRELEGHLRHFFESYVPATGPERTHGKQNWRMGFRVLWLR